MTNLLLGLIEKKKKGLVEKKKKKEKEVRKEGKLKERWLTLNYKKLEPRSEIPIPEKLFIELSWTRHERVLSSIVLPVT